MLGATEHVLLLVCILCKTDRVGCHRAPAKTCLRVRGAIWAGLASFVSGLMAVREHGEAWSCRGRPM